MSVAGSASSRGTHSRSRSRSRSPPYSDGRYPPQRYPRYDSYSYRPSRSAISAPLDDYRDIRDRERDRDRDRDRDRPPLPPREDRYIPRGRERDIRYSPYYRDDPPPSHHYNVPPASLPPRDYTKSSASASLRREVSSTDRLKDPKSSTASTFNSEIKDDTRIPGSMSDTYTPPPPRYMDWRDRERERERRYRDEDRWREMDRRGRDRDPYMRYDPPPYGPVPPLSMPPYPSFGGDSYRPDRSRDRDIPASPGGPHAPYYDRDRMDDRDYYRSGPRGPGPADMDRYRGRPGRAWGPASNSSLGRERDRDRAEHSPRSSTFFSSPTPWSRSREESRSDDRRDGGEVEKTERSDTGKLEKPNFAESQDIMRTTTESSSLLSDDADKRPKKSTEKEEEIVKNNQLSQEDKISGTEQPDESSNNQIVETKPTKSDKDDTEQTAPSLDTSMTAKKEPTSEEPVAISVPKPSSDAAAPDNAVETEPKAEHSAQSNAEAINIEPKKQESSNDEAKTEQSKQQKMMTQQEIVERIGQIENDISMYEEMLEAMTRREEAAKQQQRQAESALSSEAEAETTAKDNDDDLDLIDAQQVLKEEAAQKQALQVIEESSQTRTTDIEELSLKTSPIMRKRPQLLINQARHTDDVDDLLSEKLLKENQELAKQNSVMIGGWQGKPDNPEDWSDMDKWSKPLYARIEDYPCYKENIKAFDTIKASIASRLAEKKKMLKKKELRLKREYKALYEQWKQRNLALDRIREHEKRSSEKYNYRTSSRRRIEEDLDDYVDGIIFHGDYDALRFSSDGPTTPYGGPQKGPWTSDAARSEAELLEIIQSLESADMRNPELRAAKTTANIPPMILDAKERMQTYDDRSGLVKDPLSYYHTGPDTEDIWTQQEMTAFMESYMQYPKQFDKIAAAVKTKTVSQCVLFYYRKKTKIDFKALVSKGRRGKAGKRRDKLAAAVRRATSGNSTTTRKAKSKGSALMTDIGEAQVSRKAKEKETERKTREPKDLEEASTYWDSVHDRRRGKRPQSGSSSTSFVEDIERSRERRRFPRRKGRSPKAPSDTSVVLPGDEDEEAIDDSESGESRPTTTAKWTEKDKETAVEAFKTHGRNFAQVASMVGTKTEDQCRNFYHNHKRKYGPNAFNEESEETETRSELNAEEEDAAAALVGMCQMGAPKHTRTLSIQLEEGRQSRASMATGAVGRRRRVRSASGKATDEDATVDWMETEFGGQTGRKPGRAQASSETATRKPTYSSYWSVSERNELKRCLELYGREWDKIASILKTKTATQVRNFYVNNKEKMQLDEIVERRYQTENQDRDVAYDNAASVASTKAHFQVLQSLPFPSPLATDQTPSPAIYGPVPSNVGYYTPPHAAHPSRQHDPAAGVMHAYGPAYGTHAPAPAYPLPPAHHPTHPHSQPQPHPPPPPHIHPQAPPQTESPSTAYSRIPPEGPSASPSAASPPQPQPQPKPTAESSPSVTKVADLLNSDDAGDSTNQGNWESWFS